MWFDRALAAMSTLAVIFGAGGFASAMFQRRKMDAQAKLVESKAEMNYAKLANDWIARLQSRISELETEVASLKGVIADQWKQISDLVERLQERGRG